MTATELATLIQAMRDRGRPEQPTVPEMRARYELLGEKFPAPGDARVEKVSAGGCPAEIVAAPEAAASDRWIVYLHGGGYVIGSCDTHRNLAYALSRAADAQVLLLDYRLGPEHPFPAAVEDAVGAYRWLIARGAKAERTVIAGDSAGGGLTVSALVVLQDDGDAMPAGGVCISPWTDMEGTGATMQSKAEVDPVIWPPVIAWFADQYLAGADPKMPLASPLYADLKGLPPLLVQVGTAECLLDDAVRLADRARAAGVEVVLEPWDDMVHVWHMFAPILSEGRDAIERAGAFVRERTGG
ncbi:monoterpene epsilon-lactone hydrolase [Constrictibacter sp. MBR-5]|jgi:acetyl esterase/lipase|uniref:alpha/beta hydrolase n=1 Tax=Constrictibacter sp. MBR-5 TaxID=3156467 RepID=UPI0033937863